jgi:hypothetical protein
VDVLAAKARDLRGHDAPVHGVHGSHAEHAVPHVFRSPLLVALCFVRTPERGTARRATTGARARRDRLGGEPPFLRALVGEAVEVGAKRSSLGRTALEPKARPGAKPERFATQVRRCSPLPDAFVRRRLSAIPQDEAPERSLFKA